MTKKRDEVKIFLERLESLLTDAKKIASRYHEAALRILLEDKE